MLVQQVSPNHNHTALPASNQQQETVKIIRLKSLLKEVIETIAETKSKFPCKKLSKLRAKIEKALRHE